MASPAANSLEENFFVRMHLPPGWAPQCAAPAKAPRQTKALQAFADAVIEVDRA
jgi:hypothetical protein